MPRGLLRTTYSFTQRWALETLPGPLRPHLLVLMDEDTQRCVATRTVASPLTAHEIADWIVGQSEYPPQEVLVDDPDLMMALRFRFRPQGIRLALASEPPAMAGYLGKLKHQRSGFESYCLVDTLGRETALEIYRACSEYFRMAPPRSQLHFVSGSHRFLVTLDGGIRLQSGTNSPEGSQPLAALKLTPRAFLHPTDVDLIESHGLPFPLGAFPWFFADSPQWSASGDFATEWLWLLTHFVKLAEQDRPMLEPPRSLLRPDPRGQLLQLLQAPWGRPTQRSTRLAEFFAEYLARWCSQTRPTAADLSKTMETLGWIGYDYLRTVRKRKLDLQYFQRPPQRGQSSRCLNRTQWKRYLRVWHDLCGQEV